MISSLEKPLNSAAIGQIGKPLYGSKSDSLGNPLGEGQLICSNGHVMRGDDVNYIRLSVHNDFVINGTTYNEANFGYYAFLIYRARDSVGGYQYFRFGFQTGSNSQGSDLENDLINTNLIKTASIKIEGTGGSNYYRPYDTGVADRRSWYEDGGFLGLRTGLISELPEFISGAGNPFSNDASLVGESDSNLKVTLYV